MPAADDGVIEIWEITTEGTIWVWTKDVRNPGLMMKTRVGGKAGGSKRLRISRDERRFNEEQVIDEMTTHNPFRSGALRLVSTEDVAEDVDLRNQLSLEDLRSMLEVRDEDVFREAVEEIDSELVMRRLYMLAEKEGTKPQYDAVREVVEGRYKVGGTQKTVREMMAIGELQGGTVVSSG